MQSWVVFKLSRSVKIFHTYLTSPILHDFVTIAFIQTHCRCSCWKCKKKINLTHSFWKRLRFNQGVREQHIHTSLLPFDRKGSLLNRAKSFISGTCVQTLQSTLCPGLHWRDWMPVGGPYPVSSLVPTYFGAHGYFGCTAVSNCLLCSFGTFSSSDGQCFGTAKLSFNLASNSC